MFTLIVFLFIFSILIVVHEFGHFMAARRVGVRVERFSLGFGPQIFKKKKRDTEYCISAIPLGGFVKLAGDNPEEYKGKSYEYLAKSPGERFRIIFAGSLLNYILGLLCFWLIFIIGYPTLTTKVGGLLDGFGAQDAGIKVGDKIIAVDGKKVAFWEELQNAVRFRKEATRVKLSILRDNREFNFDILIKEKQVSDLSGQKRRLGLLGITPQDEVVEAKYGLTRASFFAMQRTWNITTMTYTALWRMITGQSSIRELTGPLGVFFITAKIARQGLVAILNFIGVISLSLAIFNLLPFPVLDGGHILLLALEKIRGRALGIKADRIITQVGITAIVFLGIIVAYNDIVRFYGDKIAGFLK